MSNGFSKDNLSQDAKNFLKQNNIDPKNLDDKNAKNILSGLSKNDAEKINRLLNDKDELDRLLNSEKAKLIMKQLFGDGAK